MITGKNRTFLFLQGPHGPFFYRLGQMLIAASAKVHRIGFNKGDQVFWGDPATYTAFTGKPEEWPHVFRDTVTRLGVTDLVIYGDTRPIHAFAVAYARDQGLTVHVFEEGYLRPYWVTYERDGSNGNSALMDMSLTDMRRALINSDFDQHEPPSHWGDMRQHVFYGAAYHGLVLLANRAYRNFKPHREITVTQEFRLYIKRLLLMPFLWLDRVLATRRIRNGGFPYHLTLLQLAHDANFQAHARFRSMAEFLETVLEGFATGAPTHHHMVFKAHPLEDGRTPIRRDIRRLAAKFGVSHRVHYVRGGKLAQLLDHARSAVTVNSTSAQQVLWRGLPLKVFGTAVYSKREFVSTQALPDFFNLPERPDTRAYRDYRHFLLETSQIAGSYYSTRGRRQLLRQVVDMMLVADDPYQALMRGTAAPRQQLRLVK